MERELTIDVEVEPDGGTLLLQLAIALRERRIRPESLVWSCVPKTQVVKLWLVLPPGQSGHLPDLADLLNTVPGVRKVVSCNFSLRPPPAEAPTFMD